MLVRISLLMATAAAAVASNVLDLTSANFNDHIGKGKPALVEFFAPWCGHCKNLAPVYEQLADAFAHAKDKVLIVKVDADGEGKEIGQAMGVTGFPTLKWFSADDAKNPTAYEGGRDLDALAEYITKQTGVKSSIKPPPPPATLQLDYKNFDEVVYDDETDVLIAFTAPWCGHCKNMKPQLEETAKNFVTEKKCIVANYDADAQPNKPIAEKFGVKSYPTIKFFPKGKKSEPIPYEEARNVAGFTKFLNEHCGTQRDIDGGLNAEAGRHPEFDALASQFTLALGNARSSIYEEAVVLAKSVGDAGKHYLKAMEKLVNGSEDYVEKEVTRLNNILKKKTLAPEKLDELKKRANILASFQKKSVEVEVEEETVSKDKEEL